MLQEEAAAAEAVVARLSGADIRSMWEEDLDAFMQVGRGTGGVFACACVCALFCVCGEA